MPLLSCLFLEFVPVGLRKCVPVLVRKGNLIAVFWRVRGWIANEFDHANQVAALGAPLWEKSF